MVLGRQEDVLQRHDVGMLYWCQLSQELATRGKWHCKRQEAAATSSHVNTTMISRQAVIEIPSPAFVFLNSCTATRFFVSWPEIRCLREKEREKREGGMQKG